MADRFFASYEDEFNSRPNAGRGQSGVLPKSDAFYRGGANPRGSQHPAFEQHWPEQNVQDQRWHEEFRPEQALPKQPWPEQAWQNPHSPEARYPADPYDRPNFDSYGREDAYSAQPMFAPLDRRAAPQMASAAQSYATQPRYDRQGLDHSPYAPQADARPYEMPADRQMSAPTYPAYGQPERALQRDRIARLTQWAGSVCSVLVLLGAVYWAYELAVRDARGIPVVRAAEGPLRIAPTTPGGEISPNQGLAVNSIAAKGGSELLPEVVTLAPAPLQLAQEDVATTASAETPAAVETLDIAADTGAEPSPAAENISAQTGSDLADLVAKTPDVMPISDEAAVEAALAMALSGGAEPVSKSNTDAAQPADMASLDPSPAGAITAPPTSEIDPANIAPGTKLVQLGAFDDDASARAAWAGLQTQFTDLIGTKSLVVQEAKSGGRVFFRLRAHGFADEDETRRFCAALLAENASCIPVSQR